MRVTCGIPTKSRYESLAQTLQSVVFQTYQDIDVIIVDDTDLPKDLRDLPQFQNLFRLMDDRKIGWRVIYGARQGQHISHQVIQDEAKTDWIWRIDDDQIAQPDVLSRLIGCAENIGYSGYSGYVGAVGGLVLIPPAHHLPPEAQNTISNLSIPNIQWFSHNGSHGPIQVDHIYSTFLYRKGIAEYERGLSPAAHREETLFTHQIKRAGYELYVLPDVITWHFRLDTGGIRSHRDPKFWEDDEKLFQDKLREWGVNQTQTKTIVLDCGKGDHVVVKSLIPELKNKYGKLVIASCFNDVFYDEDVELISIEDAKNRLGNIDRYNIYRWMLDHQPWTRSLEDAFRGMYEL